MRGDVFPTIRSTGGLLPADTLGRIAEGRGLPGLDPADYHLVEGETVRAAANRAWTRLTAAWTSFQAALAAPGSDAATGLTRERWLQVLFSELGYGRLPTTAAGGIAVGGTAYPVSHQWGSVPIHLVGARVPLDRRTPGVAGAARRPPYSLAQELLNRSDEHLWGFVSNGLRLLVLRDSSSLVRQAFVEFDLEAMFDGEVFSDFVVLYLVCHQSRVEVRSEEAGPASCWLERWRAEAIATGTRALDSLRDGVTEALRTLGQGFLTHPANGELRARLADGRLPIQAYYRALLRLVYRLLFCFVAEDRQVLLAPDAGPATVRRYDTYFSTSRLRRLAARRHGTRHGDLWTAVRLVFDALGSDEGCPRLGLPALDGVLFSPATLGLVGRSELANADLLAAVRSISQLADRASGTTRAVDYRNLDAEELGSVYESLLELVPQHDPSTGRFTLAVLAGNERKTTGSYYTPSPLVDSLLDTALDPLLDEAVKADDPEAALLGLTVCDPACGSGHFLVAAARRIARRLAAVRTDDAEPPEERVREALREVVSRCIYGVDVNALAAELAKVSLWLEAVEPGKPLPFLDAKIKVGNSLLGVTPALLAKGVPDDVFKPLTGDDRAITTALRRRNKAEREQPGQGELFDPGTIHIDTAAISRWAEKVAHHDDTTIAAVHRRMAAWEAMEGSAKLAHARLLADAWCAAFTWPKTRDAPPAVTQRVLTRLDQDPNAVSEATRKEIEQLAAHYHFFHWYLEFPEIFRVPDHLSEAEHPDLGWNGGFSCVLGNPPWERIKLQEQEFFATRDPEIAGAPNAAARGRLIDALGAEEASPQDRALLAEFHEARREAEGESHFVRLSGRYPLCGQGDINTYAIFAETARNLLAPRGYMGIIVPTGIGTDHTTRQFFGDLVRQRALVAFLDFENEARIFPTVTNRTRFCLLTLGGRRVQVEQARFAFSAWHVEDLPARIFRMAPEEILLANPNTGTSPVFRSRRDAELTLAVHRRIPVLVREGDPDGNPWNVSFLRMLDMANDSGLFRTREQLETGGWRLDGIIFTKDGERHLPLYEAKMIHHFDHRFGTYAGQTQAQANKGILPKTTAEHKDDPEFTAMPRYWVHEREVRDRLHGRAMSGWVVGWRDICRANEERTVIVCGIPAYAVGHKLPLILPPADLLRATLPAVALQANVTSFAFDYLARQKLAGASLTYSIVKQLPVIPPQPYERLCPWNRGITLGAWVAQHVLELSYTAWDMAPLARRLGYRGPPFRWDQERRAQLRAELDAAYFHLYGVAREDAEYVLDTFRLVRIREQKQHGEYRTKRFVIDVYDRMSAAMTGGEPFGTLLDPPPGHGATHPNRDRPEEAARVP
jgi:Eco57I restriction-modification methylase